MNKKLLKIIDEAVISILKKAFKPKKKFDLEKIFHLSQISKDEFDKQYRDYAFDGISNGYNGRFMVVNGGVLKEEAQETLPYEETKKEMINKYKLEDWQIMPHMESNNIQLISLVPNLGNNRDLLKDGMQNCGWYLGIEYPQVINNQQWLVMSFEPLFQEDVSKNFEGDIYFYHWTPLYNLKSILTQGLVPKSENDIFSYPNRVHLIKPNVDFNEIMGIGERLCNANRDKRNDGKYALLKLSRKRFPENIQIFYDPRYEGGCYVKQAIPSNAIVERRLVNFWAFNDDDENI